MVGLLVALLTLGAAAAAWGGLGWLLTNVPPSRPLAVLAAYVFAFAALTSTVALLFWAALRHRLAQRSPASYLAHAMLLAIIVLFAVWLQTLRTLTPIAAALLVGLYVFMELAVLFGTRGSVELPVRR
jgi:ABC-type proline/glycine betaine transport system permease subunit